MTPATITVVQTAFLGDVLLAMPMLRVLRMTFPDARLRLVTTPQAAEVVDGLDLVTEVIPFDKRGKDAGWQGLHRLAASLRCENHAMIVPHRSFRSALLLRAAQPAWSVTYRDAWARWFATTTIEYPCAMHDADRQLALAAPLTTTVVRKEDVGPIVLSRPEERSSVQALLDARGVRKPYVVLAPDSVWPTKRWPLAHVQTLAASLAHANVDVVVLGTMPDRDARNIVIEGVDLRGSTTLREAAAVIAGAKVVVCNDSAPLHLASLQHVPVIGVFGPTVTEFGFGPFGPHAYVAERTDLRCRPCSAHGTATCPLGTHECMTSITPQRIELMVNELLENT